ncbi:MAG: O-methyltransferase [Chitinophagaceae bacterium]
MYSKPTLALRYLRYLAYASSGKGHGIHSPFIFDFVTRVLNDRKHYADYDHPEELRRHMRADLRSITVRDLGAGSAVSNQSSRRVSSIARHAAKSPKYGQLLYRMARYFSPRTLIELGTSLGITTSYLARACPEASLYTLEGAPEIARLARENFEAMQLGNIRLVEGDFDDTLGKILEGIPQLDFAFIDGNHRRDPTEAYFHQLLARSHPGSVFIFDDIHWSRGMEEAWGTVCAHPAVTCTVDLFFIGIVFFRTEFYEKEHFSIRF